MAEKSKTNTKKFHIKFKDKTSQTWFKSDDFEDKDSMMKHYWNKVRAASCEVEFHGPSGKITEGLEMSTNTTDGDLTNEESATPTTMDVVDAAITGDASRVKEAFNAVLNTIINARKDAMRPEVIANMFGVEPKAKE